MSLALLMGTINLKEIDYPSNGNLRPNDILRTIYFDINGAGGECIVRRPASAEGNSLFEMLLMDYKPGCEQEFWDTSGSGVIVHTGESQKLLSLVVFQDEETISYTLADYKGKTVMEIGDSSFGSKIFSKLIDSPHYKLMSPLEYKNHLEALLFKIGLLSGNVNPEMNAAVSRNEHSSDAIHENNSENIKEKP